MGATTKQKNVFTIPVAASSVPDEGRDPPQSQPYLSTHNIKYMKSTFVSVWMMGYMVWYPHEWNLAAEGIFSMLSSPRLRRY